MKYTLYLYLFLPTLLLGQTYNKTITPTDSFYILTSIDTTSIPKNLPNGKWKVFYDNDTTRPKYVFHLNNNMVDGFFVSFNSNGNWKRRGNYKNDSSWTFRKESDLDLDTLYKIGPWEYQAGNYLFGRTYKIPYNKDSIYVSNLYYQNGKILNRTVYHQSKGIIEETSYYLNGNKKSYYEKFKEYSIRTEWSQDNRILNQTINQDFEFVLQLDTAKNNRFYSPKDCIEQSVWKDNNYIASTFIKINGKMKEFRTKDVRLKFDDEENPTIISYIRKKKWKIKKLN